MANVTTDEYFGGCPECGKNNGYLNLGGNHIFVCDDHKTAWCAGYNLFSSWHDETEEVWNRNREKLKAYHNAEPIYPPPDPTPTEAVNAWLAQFRD